mgnify:CR=1 FL=1
MSLIRVLCWLTSNSLILWKKTQVSSGTIHLKISEMAINTVVTGMNTETARRASVRFITRMAPFTKGKWKLASHTVREEWPTQMVTFTRATGLTVRPAAMVHSSTMRVQFTKDLGLTTNSTARAKKCGRRPPKFTRVNSPTEKRMAKVNFLSTEVSTMDNSNRDRCTEWVNITSPMMVRFTKANSRTTICTEKDSSSGQTFNIMTVISRMAWWTAKELFGSQMVTEFKVLLRMINPMGLEFYIASRIKLKDRELGKQVRELSGSVIPLSALFLIMETKRR